MPYPPPKRGLLALRFTQLSAKSTHWRWYLEDFAYLVPVLFIASRRASCPEGVFPCKYTADGRNAKCRLHFRREGLTAAFRKFPRALEIWVFRPRSLASHLSYPPSRPQWNSARKTAFPATKPERVSQKGKELNFTDFQKHRIMRVRRMTIEQGRRVGIDRFPNFHRTGSVRGMKRLYYGKDCLLIRCGSYVYNVSSEPRIYFQASVCH